MHPNAVGGNSRLRFAEEDRLVIGVVGLVAEADFEFVGPLCSTPGDTDHPIRQFLAQQPFLDADGEDGLIDPCGHILAGQFRSDFMKRADRRIAVHLLAGPLRELEHLQGRRLVVVDQFDLVDPFHFAAAIPAGNDEANRRPLVFGQGLPVKRVARKAPACSSCSRVKTQLQVGIECL